MAPKRPLENAKSGQASKKPRNGFRANTLPDGPWRRKVDKAKQGLIEKTKVKKRYAKIKAQEQASKPKRLQSAEGSEKRDDDEDGDEKTSPETDSQGEVLHPTRQLMLKDEEAAQTGAGAQEDGVDGQRRRTRRPGYYDKQLQKAEERRAEKEAREQEFQRRREERERRIAERERYRRAMAKTKGPDGKKKLGRESTILLDKVKKMMAEK